MKANLKFHLIPIIIIVAVIIIILVIAKCGKEEKVLSPKEVVTEVLEGAKSSSEAKFTKHFDIESVIKKYMDSEIWYNLTEKEKKVVLKVAAKMLFQKRENYDLKNIKYEIEKELINEDGLTAEVYLKINYSNDTIITKIIKLKKVGKYWKLSEFNDKNILHIEQIPQAQEGPAQ
ncbi:MAG TPA: hypothetical protein PLD27_11510 [bacterium]|nr:hypothetical protein [bacterium]HPQ19516.1 hypothetical protein [bacterium]